MDDPVAHLRRRTTDPAEADLLLREANGRFQFSSEPESDFVFRVEQSGVDGFSVGRYSIAGEWESDGEFDQFCVSSVFAGDYEWEIDGDRDFSFRAPFLSRPGHDLFGRGKGLGITNIYLDPERLREVARVAFADDRLTLAFSSPRPVSVQHAAHLRDVAQVATEFVHAGTFENDLVRAGLFHEVALATLRCFPLIGERSDRHDTPAGRTSAYRRATRFVDDNLSLPITAGDIAGAAGVSLAQLDAAFRERSASSANAYLRAARLSAAHDELARDPSVGAGTVASRWGFATVADFERRYHRAYGRLPG